MTRYPAKSFKSSAGAYVELPVSTAGELSCKLKSSLETSAKFGFELELLDVVIVPFVVCIILYLTVTLAEELRRTS